MECTMDHNHYVSQLKPMPTTIFDKQADSDKANDEQVSLYMSLLGDVAWMVLTRADIVVYVGRLFRNLKDVKISDLTDLNQVLKWIKRVPSTIRVGRPTSPLCMSLIADSADRADD
eukprot:8422612-Pyramimonas_sp.AAC.1